MKKSIKNIGTALDLSEQQSVLGGNRHYWEHTGVFYDEHRIFDATTLRVREISLSVTS